MKQENIFIGDIKKCLNGKYTTGIGCAAGSSRNFQKHNIPTYFKSLEDEVIKKDVILVRFKNGVYIDLDEIENVFDYLSLKLNIAMDKYGIFMATNPQKINDVFVDYQSLKPYSTEKRNVSIKQLKK